jgi:5-methylcytosine-specific restriction endonuclease McrA
MPSRPAHRCRCGVRIAAGVRFCHECEAERNAIREHYRGDWPEVSRRRRAEWVAEHGPLCPGWGRPPHFVAVEDLTVDHVIARSRAELVVLCRPCNGRKAGR